MALRESGEVFGLDLRDRAGIDFTGRDNAAADELSQPLGFFFVIFVVIGAQISLPTISISQLPFCAGTSMIRQSSSNAARLDPIQSTPRFMPNFSSPQRTRR